MSEYNFCHCSKCGKDGQYIHRRTIRIHEINDAMLGLNSSESENEGEEKCPCPPPDSSADYFDHDYPMNHSSVNDFDFNMYHENEENCEDINIEIFVEMLCKFIFYVKVSLICLRLLQISLYEESKYSAKIICIMINA